MERDASDPGFLQSFERLAAAAIGRGALSRKMRELVGLAVNAAVTHLHEPAMRRHIRAALAAGAGSAEIQEVLQLVSVLGIHSCSLGIAALTEEMRQAGIAAPAAMQEPLSDRQEAIRSAFRRDRGYWSERWDALLRLDPDFFEGYAAFSAHPWRTGSLAPKEREFVYIAIDASTTHLYDPGLRLHIRNALRLGAGMEEILEVLKLTSLIGMQSHATGTAILTEELRRGSVAAGAAE